MLRLWPKGSGLAEVKATNSIGRAALLGGGREEEEQGGHGEEEEEKRRKVKRLEKRSSNR